ncbi:MAG: isocitrate lyase/PEP mutase family protein, partial [Acidimicrobiales bacterium]
MTRSLRELIDADRALVLPGITNAVGAAIAVDVGFEALYLTGAGITNSELALPDQGFISLTDLAAQVGRVRDAVNVPIVVDADTGFGNALNVIHCVRVLERSGANAIQLEDQVFPKRCGHFAGKQVASAEEMVSKIKAAVDTRRSTEFLVIARTDALAVVSIDEVFARTDAYAQAGADVIFVEALTTIEEMAEVPRHVSLPLLVNMV